MIKYYWQYLKYWLRLTPWKPFKPSYIFKLDGKEQVVDAKYKVVGKTCYVTVTSSQDETLK